MNERTEAGSRPLADVRVAVQREWLAARRKDILDATYRKLRDQYAVTVEYARRQADATRQSVSSNVAQRP